MANDPGGAVGRGNVGVPYEDLFRKYAKPTIPWWWMAAQAKFESGFNPRAVSSAGAKGLTQFMPATWGEWGSGDPFNPEDSIKAQGRYMEWVYNYIKRFHPTNTLWWATVAYCWGPGNVSKVSSPAAVPADVARYANNISQFGVNWGRDDGALNTGAPGQAYMPPGKSDWGYTPTTPTPSPTPSPTPTPTPTPTPSPRQSDPDPGRFKPTPPNPQYIPQYGQDGKITGWLVNPGFDATKTHTPWQTNPGDVPYPAGGTTPAPGPDPGLTPDTPGGGGGTGTDVGDLIREMFPDISADLGGLFDQFKDTGGEGADVYGGIEWAKLLLRSILGKADQAYKDALLSQGDKQMALDEAWRAAQQALQEGMAVGSIGGTPTVDKWYKEEQIRLDEERLALTELQVKLDEARVTGDYNGVQTLDAEISRREAQLREDQLTLDRDKSLGYIGGQPTLPREEMESGNALKYLDILSRQRGPRDWVSYWNTVEGAKDTMLPSWATNLIQGQNAPAFQSYYGQQAGGQGQPLLGGQSPFAGGQGGWGYDAPANTDPATGQPRQPLMPPNPFDPNTQQGWNPYDPSAPRAPQPPGFNPDTGEYIHQGGAVPLPASRQQPGQPVQQPLMPPTRYQDNVRDGRYYPQDPAPRYTGPTYSIPRGEQPTQGIDPATGQPVWMQPPQWGDPNPVPSPGITEYPSDYYDWRQPLLPDGMTPNPYYRDPAPIARRELEDRQRIDPRTGMPIELPPSFYWPEGGGSPRVLPYPGMNDPIQRQPLPGPGYSPFDPNTQEPLQWQGGRNPYGGVGPASSLPYEQQQMRQILQQQRAQQQGQQMSQDRTGQIPSWAQNIGGIVPWQVRPQQWNNMMPSAQEGLRGAVEQFGGWAPDWEAQMRRAWPTGNVTGRSWFG